MIARSFPSQLGQTHFERISFRFEFSAVWTSQQTKVGLNEVGGDPEDLRLSSAAAAWRCRPVTHQNNPRQLNYVRSHPSIYPCVWVCQTITHEQTHPFSHYSTVFIYIFFFHSRLSVSPNPTEWKDLCAKCHPQVPRNSHSATEKIPSKSRGSECWILWIFTTLGWVA